MESEQPINSSSGVFRETNSPPTERIAELYKAGRKINEICELVGRSRSIVNKWISILNLTDRNEKSLWTAKEEELLKRGIRPPNRSSDSIRYKCRKLGIGMPPAKSFRKLHGKLLEKALELRRSGLTIREIAREVNFSTKTVVKEFKKLGVSTIRPGLIRTYASPPKARMSREQELELINSFPVRRMPSALSPEFKDVPLMTFDKKAKRYGRPELAKG